jgi:hypothetical protein
MVVKFFRYILILLYFNPINNVHAQNIFSFNASIEYGWHLINKQNYKEAYNELIRIENTFGNSDTLRYMNLVNDANQLNKAAFFQRMQSYLSNKNMKEYIFLYGIKVSFLNNNIVLTAQINDSSNLAIHNKDLIKCYISLYQLDTIKARLLINTIVTHKQYCEPLDSLLLKVKSIKLKSKNNALILSTFVPGLGKLYANQPKNGLISFFSTGLFAFQSYRGFIQKGSSSIYGWIYLTASAAFYAGNIYGAHTAVTRYNNEKINLVRDEIKTSFNCALY